ncbi:MAG TPA: nitronate monooxygenase, partial [Bacteroidetes bacterium]|nr:nitronate monooxygenase [Bacteroidota bacterium]
MPKLRIGDLEVEKPIIQGGMGVGISMSGLASAVANKGGIGVISSVGMGMMIPGRGKKAREDNRNLLIEEIRKAKNMSGGIIGVNIMVALTDYDDMVKLSLDENVDILFLGAGLPLRFSKDISLTQLRETRTKFVPIVSSARAAHIIFKFWQKNFNRIPDGVVVEGPLAGGHLGFKKEQIYDLDFALEKIVPDVLITIHQYEERFGREIPVIAAGGIYTGEDIHKFLELGVQGVQMATRFVATYECDASDEFKQSYIRCKKEDITIIDSPVGLPGRAIRNRFLDEVSAGARKPF